jgi:hypothetical protein
MDDHARLCDLARAELNALHGEGIYPDADEIVEINALAWHVVNPHTRLLLSRGRPVRVGGVSLWPLTFRAVDWLQGNDVDLGHISPAVGYAMCYGRSDGGELDVYGPAADAAVVKWTKSLRCTADELNEAIAQVDRQDAPLPTPPDADGKPMSIGDFSAYLTATCGADPDFWERRCSVGYALSVMSMFVMQSHSDKTPCANDPKIIAERALGFAIEKIKMRHAAEQCTNG